MLEVRGLKAGYGRATILFDVSFDVGQGEAVALLGRNGAGKSTALKAIAGWLKPSRGNVRLGGRRIDGAPSYRIARAGLGFVPEGRRIFSGLTVAQNLEIGRRDAHAGTAWTPQRLFLLFPALAELRDRRGGEISGGEQQMLAIARTLMGNPT
ncbi:MAG: ATP-binding cassette domain-containing protein, partial [Betaproteobacteria bacterium]